VAGADGKAEIRSVEMGPRVGELWVVEKGLKAGENVIVSGLQYLRSGTPITAKPAPAPSPPAPASP
jgi:multidrug efflux pump subunit AcrA (membrane-fusion protein)